MKIQDLLKLYAQSPQVKALGDTLKKKSVKTVFLEGLMCSSAPVVFAAIGGKAVSKGKPSVGRGAGAVLPFQLSPGY